MTTTYTVNVGKGRTVEMTGPVDALDKITEQMQHAAAMAENVHPDTKKLTMLDKEVRLAIEYIDLANRKIGLIISMSPAGKSGRGIFCRPRLNMPEIVVNQVTAQIAKADPLTAAAPDLLMACRAFVAILKDPLLAKMDPVLKMAEAAVEKAEGK